MSRDGSKTRNRILQSALDLLVEDRGKGVRVGDIAKRAGITRQALYLHFGTRSELLIAATLYLDELNNTEERLLASRTAKTGIGRLDAYIEAWGSYIPEIHGAAKALMTMQDTDEAAAQAWSGRMQAMKHGCQAAVDALNDDGVLSLDADEATDILWTMLSVRNWEQLRLECGWSQEKYIDRMKMMARQILVVTAG